MVLHRCHTMSYTYNNFTCRTYMKKGSNVCSAHYIRECVLEDIRRVTAMARKKTAEFASYIGSRQSAEICREVRQMEAKLASMKKHRSEMDAIFKRLYEDSVPGRITPSQFQALLQLCSRAGTTHGWYPAEGQSST